jgi:DNA invertase Pin-like site-specific DNA recombinase
MAQRFITYLRVSTQKQGAEGLGISAQRSMCEQFVSSKGGEVVKEFLDVESGKSRTRAELWQAIEYAKANNVPLVIAKLDRLARDVEFTFKVMNTGIEIHFTDMPVVNTMILGVFASVAQYERELISARTKAALRAKVERGETWVRNTDTTAARAVSCKMRTDARLDWLTTSPVCKYIRAKYEQGMSFPDMVEDLAKMYEIAPEIYCTRNGCAFTKGSLWKVWAWCREQSEPSELSERDRRNAGKK